MTIVSKLNYGQGRLLKVKLQKKNLGRGCLRFDIEYNQNWINNTYQGMVFEKFVCHAVVLRLTKPSP